MRNARWDPWIAAIALLLACAAPWAHAQSPFATPGAALPGGLDEVARTLWQDGHDLELLISFGTSRGGSAGHLALAVRGDAREATVYSANFYADRAPEHEGRHYTRELMVAIPAMEYLYGTSSSLAPTAAFGLDFGEVYKRSVVGVRVRGVPQGEKDALVAYFARINDDFRRRARDTEYHDGEVRYDYLRLNCAKTIGSAFKYGAGYADLEVSSARILSRRRIVAAANANVPTEMAMRLMKEWAGRGYGMEAVLYRKYPGSTYVDPLDDDAVAFKDLPNRFPSVLSRDFRREAGGYKDYDNLEAMYLLWNLARYVVRVDEATGSVGIERERMPLAWDRALELARRHAAEDSGRFGRGETFRAGAQDLEDPPRP